MVEEIEDMRGRQRGKESPTCSPKSRIFFNSRIFQVAGDIFRILVQWVSGVVGASFRFCNTELWIELD